MAFSFLQKKFDRYTEQKSKELFESACNQLMKFPLDKGSPLVCSVRMQMETEKHIVEKVVSLAKDCFGNLNMRAEVLARITDASVVEFKLNVFDGESFSETKEVVSYFWSRCPGKFVNKTNGNPVVLDSALQVGPSFTGTVREWYETLVETVIDASNCIKQETDQFADTIRCGPDVATIFECSVLFRPTLEVDNTSPYLGVLCRRFNVIKDDTMPRNMIEVFTTINGVKYVSKVSILDMNII